MAPKCGELIIILPNKKKSKYNFVNIIILKTKQKTPMCFQLGRIPTSNLCDQRILMYRFKVISNNHSVIYNMYQLLRTHSKSNTISKCNTFSTRLRLQSSPGNRMNQLCHINVSSKDYETCYTDPTP